MEKSYTQTKEIHVSYKECDSCGDKINEKNGTEWFELSSYIGQFRNDCGDLHNYHFCTYECLKEFIDKHEPALTSHAELVKKK